MTDDEQSCTELIDKLIEIFGDMPIQDVLLVVSLAIDQLRSRLE